MNAQQEDETKLVGSLPYEKDRPTESSNSQTEIDEVKKRKSEKNYPKVSPKIVFKN